MGLIRRSISSGSTTICRCRTGATASSTPMRRRAGPAIYDRAYLQGNIAGRRGLRLVLSQRGGPLSAGPHPDHRRCRQQAMGLPLQGSAQLVVERALRSPGRGWRGGTPTAWAPQSKPNLVHRVGLPRHRPGHQPAQRLLRSEVLRELRALLSPAAGGTMRSSAPISKRRISGGARSRTTRFPQSTAAGWCMSPNAPPGPGTRDRTRSFRP